MIQRDYLAPFLIICEMGFSLLIIVGGICYTQVSAFDAIVCHYLSGAYPLMLASEWFAILYMLQLFLNKKLHDQ